ncbi:MAG: hypothetical protein NVS3B21_17150 [Acidimicrobiales bacterium]
MDEDPITQGKVFVFEETNVDDAADPVHVDTSEVFVFEELHHLAGYPETHDYIFRRRRYRVTSGIERTPTTTPTTVTAPARTVAITPTTAITSPLS